MHLWEVKDLVNDRIENADSDVTTIRVPLLKEVVRLLEMREPPPRKKG